MKKSTALKDPILCVDRTRRSIRSTALLSMTWSRQKSKVREGVGIMDVTAFTKVVLSGPGAYTLLDRLTANRMHRK